MRTLPLTGSQTVGPFFHDCLLRADAQCAVLAAPEMRGAHIRIAGRVLDGDGAAVPDAMIEIWQANSHGRYNHPSDTRDLPLDPDFTGYGRTGTDADGAYWFETIKPGRVPFDVGTENIPSLQAPHICVAVFARGLLNHLFTRLYFADEPSNADDPVLQRVPAERRATLVAQPSSDRAEYRFDIVLQGAGETAFFNI
jgi:protocatechuate 3,4-dioxygenase alpha subunit